MTNKQNFEVYSEVHTSLYFHLWLTWLSRLLCSVNNMLNMSAMVDKVFPDSSREALDCCLACVSINVVMNTSVSFLSLGIKQELFWYTLSLAKLHKKKSSRLRWWSDECETQMWGVFRDMILSLNILDNRFLVFVAVYGHTPSCWNHCVFSAKWCRRRQAQNCLIMLWQFSWLIITVFNTTKIILAWSLSSRIYMNCSQVPSMSTHARQ